ncbi:PAS domain S-box-containing protein [Halomicrobium zhouii]|uniref:histidine kinase n=1 Tax=Halomicrobium zhouii TaxID=767519 RepID=A0A1I6M834_9EURY|nr:PAS domain S-box protein [Halomicrobium zhouii]SFS11793.1 PAS domain S-box-containing protein [Halomicrobium zhouii]
MTASWGVVPATDRWRHRWNRVHAWFVLSVAFCVAVSVGIVGDPAVFGSPGGPGQVLVGFVGLAVAGGDDDDDAVADLLDRIERFEDGEDVDFESDREDDIGLLYDAVGSLADRAGGSDRRTGGAGRELERHATATDDALDAVEDVFAVIDEDGYPQRWNERLADVLGYDDAEMASTHVLEWFPADDHRTVEGAIRAASETGSVRVEAPLTTVDGEQTTYEFVASALEDADGNPVVAAIGRDVSERTAREAELERQASLLDSLFERLPVSLYVKDREGRHVRTSIPYHREQYPDDEEWFIGKTDPEIYDSELAAETHADDRRVIEEGEPIVEKVEFDPADEEWLLTSKVPWRDEDGDVRGLIGISQYVTEQKERERELRETKRKLELTLEGTRTGIYDWNMETNEVDWSETFERMLGLEPGTFEGTYDDFERRVHPDDVSRIDAAVDRALENDELFLTEFRLRHEDGRWIWVNARGWVVVDEEGHRRMVGINHDITERKEREQQLQRYKEYTDDILDALDDVFYVLDSNGNLQRWNESMSEVTGYTDDELRGKQALEFFSEQDVEAVSAAIEEVFETGNTRIEVEALTKDGRSIPYELVAARLEDPEGNQVLAGIGRDVSERRRLEQDLRTEKEHFRVALENSPLVAFRQDTDLRYTWVGNPQRDFRDHEVIGKRDDEIFPPQSAETLTEIKRSALETGDAVREEVTYELPSGEEVTYDLTVEPFRNESGEIVGLTIAALDITERREREAEIERTTDLLEQAGRIARIGGWELDLTTDPPEMTWTDELYDIHGVEPGTPVDVETVVDRYHPEDREYIENRLEAAIERGESYDMEVRIQSGSDQHRWVRALGEAVSEDGEVVKLRGSIQDITEQKEREAELRATKNRMQKFIETSPVGVVGTTPEGIVTLWNDAMEQIFGWSAEEVLGEPYPAISDGDDDPDPVRQRVLDGEAISQVELERVTKDGEQIDVSLSTGPVYDAAGDISEVVGYIEDITERKERERELQETNERLNAVIDASPDAIVALDTDGTVTLWNPAAERIFGWREDEILGEPMPIVPPERAEEHADILRRLADGETVRGAEVLRQTRDGERIELSLSAAPLRDADGTIVGNLGVSEDISRRKERQRELERTKDMLAQAQQLAAVGGWELDLAGDEPVLEWTDELYRIHGLPPGADVTLDEALDFYHTEDRPRIRDAIDRVVETGGTYDEETRFYAADGEQRWVRAIGKAIQQDGETVKLRGAFQDITRQKERELALQSLHDATRGLLHTESETEVAELVVETAAELFDVSGVAVYTIDDASNRLVPAAYTDAFDALSDGAPSVGVGDDAAVWNCFATGERVVFDDAETARQSRVFGESVDGGLLVPMGDHGVFVVATDGPRIDDDTRRLAETLVATTEAAFDRLASEADLRKRDEELEAQNRRLRRQIQINDIIRRVDQSLVGATSREEVESAVCDRLVESDDVAFAWIGGFDGDGDELVPRAWAGPGQTYLDTLALDDLKDSTEPSLATARSGEATVVGNVVDRLREDAWRRGALANDFHSVISVPLAVDEYSHGALTVYAGEPDTFGDLERTVFAELGRSIANAINAVSAREALHADTVVELTLRFDDPNGVLSRVARDADCDVEYEGISTRSADETRLFFATTGAAADAVADVLEGLYAVTECRLVSESDDGRCLFEVTVTGTVLPSALVDQGASPRSIRATPIGTEVVVDLPTSTDVREFVETLGEEFPSVELAGRRNVERGMGTRQQLLSSLLGELTDRQLEVLRTAYFAGFFEWPRQSTGEEVAEMLDVTQPTVNRHLRLGQQRLLAQLFDEEAPDLVAA